MPRGQSLSCVCYHRDYEHNDQGCQWKFSPCGCMELRRRTLEERICPECADIWRVDEEGRVMVMLGRFGQIQEGPLFELPDEEDYERGACPKCRWAPYLQAAELLLYSA